LTRGRGLWRLARLLLHLLAGLWTQWRHFPRLSAAGRDAAVQAWSVQALRLLGVHLVVSGLPPQAGPRLVVANHVSWLDILVINASRPCRFVAKADVQTWPLIGSLVAAAGTLFIERERRRDAVRVVHHLAEQLQAGGVLAVFPEGTTGDGQALLPFHANLLQAALVTDTPVQPLGLSYRRAAGAVIDDAAPRHAAPVYIGNTTLLASVWCTLSATDLQARLCWGEAEQANGRDRRTWSQALRTEVARLADVPLLDNQAHHSP
jgi:1-acyl-sn-glycerol-3-phosphate acyltransferase